MRIVDSHQHIWRIHAPGHAWPDADWPLLHRDFGMADLRAATAGVDLIGTVLVQSQPDDRDTDWMLEVANADPLVKAVVGWVDLIHPDAPTRIARLARHPRLKGLRPMLQGIADSEWMLRPELAPAIEAMIVHGLRFDALIEPRHLRALATFAKRWLQLPIVIDHAAKPRIAAGAPDPWRDEIAALAALPHIHCKLSGLRTEQAPGASAEALQPYVTHLLTCFGDRLMWGSDWPVLLHAGDSYGDWVETTLKLAGPLGEKEERALFAESAIRFYGIDI